MLPSSPHRRLLACATVLALAAVAVLPAVSPARGRHGARSADTTCDRPFASGSGATTFDVCFSNHGNLVSITSPAGKQHISGGREGYAICSRIEETAYYDFGPVESGFGPATVSQPNGAGKFPLTVTRTTTDGDFRFVQKATWSTANRTVSLTMSVTNLSASNRQDFKVARYFDANVGGTANDRFARTLDSVWGWDDLTGYGLMLSARNPGAAFPRENQVALAANFDPSDPCFVAGVGTPTGNANFFAEQIIDVQGLNAGKTKSVAVAYTRF